MDGTRFDNLIRALSISPSRRAVVNAAVGGALAAVFGRIAVEDAAAAKDRCRGKPDACKVRNPRRAACGPFREGGRQCACITDRDGKKQCVDASREECPTRDECDRNEDCPGGKRSVCVVVTKCCEGSPRNLCLRTCGRGGRRRGRRATATAGLGGSPLLRRR